MVVVGRGKGVLFTLSIFLSLYSLLSMGISNKTFLFFLVISRTNAFEVMGIDGNSSGILQFEDSLSLAEWIAAITNNITQLLNQMV